MASFVTMDLNSDSDSDDGDFVPEANKCSDDSDSDADCKAKGIDKKAKKAPNRAGGIYLEGETPGEEMINDCRRDEFEKEKKERKELENERKVDDLWASFKKDTSATNVPKIKTTAKTNTITLGSLSSINQSKKKIKNKSTDVKKPQAKNIMSSIFDDFEKKNKVEHGHKNVDSKIENSAEIKVPKSIISSIFENCDDKLKVTVDQAEEKGANNFKNTHNENNVNSLASEKTITITKTYDFAGENIEITKEVDKDSKEGKHFLKQNSSVESESSVKKDSLNKRSASGLSSIMGVISGKKQKLGCLDKSKMDWNKFVAQEGIKEELETHNKGKDGYVEKQMFLERADYRRFEIEKEAREKTRKPLNN